MRTHLECDDDETDEDVHHEEGDYDDESDEEDGYVLEYRHGLTKRRKDVQVVQWTTFLSTAWNQASKWFLRAGKRHTRSV